MVFQERVYSVLVVSSEQRFSRSLSPLLPETDYYPVHSVSSAAAAQRAFLERPYDFLIIDAPLPDDFGIKLAAGLCDEKNAVALLFVKSEMYADITSKASEYGIFTLSRPISAQTVSYALRWMCATRERLRRLEKKSVSMEEKMEEIRLVNRAKWILIDRLKMTEADAHRYIEKQAMDLRISRREAAENIIKTYK